MVTNLVKRECTLPVSEQLVKLSKMSEQLLQTENCKVYANEDLAKLLRVSTRTLQNWRNEGLIDFSQIGSKIYYTQEAVQQMLVEHKKAAFRNVNHG